MANHAYLVGGANADPAGPVGDGVNYDPDTEILAASSGLIPALWLCAFGKESLTTIRIETNSIPTLVTFRG